MNTLDRRELLLSLINTQGVGLEIGPGFNPLVRATSAPSTACMGFVHSAPSPSLAP